MEELLCEAFHRVWNIEKFSLFLDGGAEVE
jgi:hypothetical protein